MVELSDDIPTITASYPNDYPDSCAMLIDVRCCIHQGRHVAVGMAVLMHELMRFTYLVKGECLRKTGVNLAVDYELVYCFGLQVIR